MSLDSKELLSKIQKLKGFTSGKNNPSEMSKPKHLQEYDISNLNYPLDLFDAKKPVGPYIMFYINVSSDSRIANSAPKGTFVDNVDRPKAGSARRLGLQKESVLLTSFGTATGALSAIGLSAPASALGTGAAIAVMESQNLNFERPMKRLKSAIALHMPSALNIRYAVSYKSSDASTFLAASKFIQNAAIEPARTAYSTYKALDEANRNTADQEAATAAGKEMSKIPTAFVNGVIDGFKASGSAGANVAMGLIPGGDVISTLTGVAANPLTQQVFSGIDPRSFSYEYSFYPKNATELEHIQEIIKAFKSNMLPEYKGADEFLFIYPSEFDIIYYMGGEENQYIHKHTSCVLTSMDVNYSPDGNFSYFNNGAPTRVSVRLEFRELDIITKQDAEAGY